MKILITLTLFVISFYSFVNINGHQIKNNYMEKNNQSPVDTLAIIYITDSIAAIELKKYDEQSLRETGVPISLCHFDKTLSADKKNTIFTVLYNFNQQKFYGKNWKQTEIPNSNRFPYRFSIDYNLTTKKTIFLKDDK